MNEEIATPFRLAMTISDVNILNAFVLVRESLIRFIF